jgi:hypothetical protein
VSDDPKIERSRDYAHNPIPPRALAKQGEKPETKSNNPAKAEAEARVV